MVRSSQPRTSKEGRISAERGSGRSNSGWLSLLAPAAAAGALLLGAPSAAADDASCTYTSMSVPVNITPSSGFASELDRSGSEIRVVSGDTGLHDCGAATVTNTSFISLNDASQNRAGSVGPFYINLWNGPYAPGLGDEAGSSDEIEFTVNFGSGHDELGVDARNAPAQTIRLGDNGKKELMNVNAAEADGVDSDVTLHGVDRVLVLGSVASDRLRANGGAGTGGGPFENKLDLEGFDGADHLVGGRNRDEIFGDSTSGVPGNDTLNGGRAHDMMGGGGGADVLKGGRGPDVLYGESGHDSLNGGPGMDVCVGGPGTDTFKGCEHKQA